MNRKDWLEGARQRAALQIQLFDELHQQKLELVEYYSFLASAPADIKHEYSAIPEIEISAAAKNAVARLRKGDYRFSIDKLARDREILIDWAARIRALDELVFENGDLAPLSAERWRVRTTAADVYLVPRWRPRPNTRRRETGSIAHRGMIHHRMIPAMIGDWRVSIAACRGRLSKSDDLRFGAGLFPGLSLTWLARPDLVAERIEFNDYAGQVTSHLTRAHDDECHVLMFPELTIDPVERSSIQAALERRPWTTAWSTSLVIAGSWHDEENGIYFNVATAFDGFGTELVRHRKIFRYFDNKSGRGEGIELGKCLTLLVFDDLIVALGICRDFCERIDPTPNPFAALDADLFLIPSMGNKTTMKGHIETAREIALKYRASAFVVQQSESERPVGYLIFPGQDLDKASSDFEVDNDWAVRKVDSAI